MRFDERLIADLRQRADLAGIVRRHVELKSVGASLRGLCPFHGEKTPSFYVHPERQRYHCFGCQASGDAFSFLMEIEGLTFVEAVEAVARELGIDISQAKTSSAHPAKTSSAASREKERNERLAHAMAHATSFFERALREDRNAKAAQEAIRARAITPETAKAFRLGYAPQSWDALVTHLRKQEVSMRDAEAMGLVAKRRSGDGFYDRFRDRLMFPVTDAFGNVIAFSGRRVERQGGPEGSGQNDAPKYINSPETPLYKKGDNLFGLFQSRVGLRKAGRGILCEGNFDVVKLHDAGFTHAVAPLGTALTLSQARLLRRYVTEVLLMFDGDAAGKKAAIAAFPIMVDAGVSARVVIMPSGHDPDSFLRDKGADALRGLMESAPTLVEFLIDRAASTPDASSHAKGVAISNLGPILGRVENAVERRLYVERVAQRFGISDLKVVKQALRAGFLADKTTNAAISRKEPQQHEPARRRPRNAITDSERELLGAVLDQPGILLYEDVVNAANLLTNAKVRDIFSTIQQDLNTSGTHDVTKLLGRSTFAVSDDETPGEETVADADAQWMSARIAAPRFTTRSDAYTYASQVVAKLRRSFTRQEIGKLKTKILEARNAGDHGLANELMRRHTALLQGATHLDASGVDASGSLTKQNVSLGGAASGHRDRDSAVNLDGVDLDRADLDADAGQETEQI